MLTFRLRCLCRAALAAVVALCAVTVVTAQTQSLAEVARKEQERRKTQKPASKTYTNKDLPESAKGRTAQPAPPPQPVTEGTKPPADKSASGEDEKDETWWKTRINQAREELRRNEAFAEALQTRINSLSADFVNRDDPAQRALIADDRNKAIVEIARVKAEIDRGKKQIEDIEEEARKAGVPPGWLR
jgi:hypothetical protein